MNFIEDSFYQHQRRFLLFLSANKKIYQKLIAGAFFFKSAHFYPQISLKSQISDGRLTTYTLNQSINGREGNFDYLVSGTYESRGGMFDADGDRVNPDPAQVSRMDTDTKDALIKLGYNLTNEKRLEATLQHFDDQMDSDYAANASSLNRGDSDDAPAALKGLQLSTQPYSKRNSVDLVYKDLDFYGNNLQLQSYYREREARFYPYPNDPFKNNTLFVNQSTSTAKVFGFKLNLDTDINEAFKVSYGFDYDVDKGEQKGRLFDRQEYANSGGTTFVPEGSEYDYGPAVDTTTFGLYLQSSYELTQDLVLNAGFRHERAAMDISDYTPLAEIWFLPILAPGTNPTDLQGDVRKYDANLFNVGVVYKLNSSNEVFANYAQGFEVPDASRILRNAVNESSPLVGISDAVVGTDVSNANLDAIKTDSFELGWRGQFESLFVSASAFYNESDKTISFNADHNVDLLDQKRKIYGIEGALEFYLSDYWSIGGSYAFTEGRSYYKDAGKWLDLQAADVSPEKFTTFVAYGQEDMNVRLQSTSFADYDKGKSYSKSKNTVTGYDIDGYTTVDLLASFNMPVGTVKAGITNLLNEDYETVYSQWANSTYNGLSAHKAEGRAYSLSYRVEY